MLNRKFSLALANLIINLKLFAYEMSPHNNVNQDLQKDIRQATWNRAIPSTQKSRFYKHSTRTRCHKSQI